MNLWNSSTSSIKTGTLLALLAGGFLPLAPSPGPGLAAQDLTYTNVTRMEMGGVMGAMMQRIPDSVRETRQTVYMKGTLLRTDAGGRSTIVDPSSHALTMLEHDSRTFSTMSVEEMLQMAETTWKESRESLRRLGTDPDQIPGARVVMMAQGAGFEPKVSVQRTGEEMEIQGHRAERIIMITEMVATDPEAEEMVARTGRQITVSDSWYTIDLPGYEALQKRWEELAEDFPGGVMEAILGSSGQEAFMASPLGKGIRTMAGGGGEGLEGLPVKSVVSFVTLPMGMEFDLDAVLASEDEPLEAEGGMSMEAAAMEAARGAMGQTITMRSTTLMVKVDDSPLPEEIFRPPADYTEAKPEWMKGK